MTRTIPAAVQTALERPSSPDAILWFVTITHQDLTVPVRFVSDNFDYILDGQTYTRARFDGRLVSDTDQPPSLQLDLPNVSRVIGRAIERATGFALVTFEVYSAADFDLTQDPRVPVGTPAVIYRSAGFRVLSVDASAAVLSCRIGLRDFFVEPWPGLRATQDILPGLFT